MLSCPLVAPRSLSLLTLTPFRDQAAGSSRSAVIGAAAAAAAAGTAGSRDALRTALHQNSVEAEALRARLRQLEEERRQLEQLLG